MELITTPNPNAKKIEINHALTIGNVITSAEDTDNETCLLLLNIQGITSIFVGPGFLTISKKDEAEWESINSDIVNKFDKL
ncbi:NifU N-terminal domain-containing protein [Acidimicrobiia bacterium]|nr:NifU N-terminal domain-containing protein [Acidimicrobiia bacterium]